MARITAETLDGIEARALSFRDEFTPASAYSHGTLIESSFAACSAGLVAEVRRLRELLCAVFDTERPFSELEDAAAEVEAIKAEAREERGK